MKKAKELYTTTKIVKEILMQDERARNSDNFLYLRVLGVVGMMKGVDVYKMSIPTLLLYLPSQGFPSLETVGRCRRKIVQHYPELAGCRAVEAQRTLHEDIYKEYAKKVNI